MSRTRSRDLTLTVPASAVTTITCETYRQYRYFPPNGQYYRDPGVYTPPVDHYAIPFSGKIGVKEAMTDEHTSPGSFNYCLHDKISWDCPLESVKMTGSCSNSIGQSSVESTFTMGAAVACAHVEGSFPFLESDANLQAEAISNMHPQVIKPGFDASLQAAEMVEAFISMKALVNRVRRIKSDLDRLNKWNSPRVRRILGQRTYKEITLRNWADLAVSLDLGYTLALKPTIDATKQLVEAVRKHANVVKRVTSERVTLHGVSSRKSTRSSFQPSYTHHWGASIEDEVEVRVTAEVQYHSPLTNELLDELDRAYYGLVPSISTAWEALPLSFIVDMFWNLGNYLAGVSKRPLASIQYTVISTGWSKTNRMTVHGWVDPCKGSDRAAFRTIEAPSLITGSATRMTYLREPKAFDLTEGKTPPPDIGLPSLPQAKTIAEIAYAITDGFKNL